MTIVSIGNDNPLQDGRQSARAMLVMRGRLILLNDMRPVVVPALTRNCKSCHTRGGVNQSQLFDTYDQVHALRTSILTQVNSCRMPPADAGTMTTAERQALLGWVVCGAKNN